MKKFFVAAVAGIVVIWLAWGMLPRSSDVLLEAWMLNVGQGESVLVRESTGKLLLFDGGPDDSVLRELGDVLPAWEHRLDLVVLSHPHADHIQGLIAVLNRYEVSAVWSSGTVIDTADFRAWQAALSAHRLKPTVVFAGTDIELGAAHLQVYFPLTNMAGAQPVETHDGDVVLKITEASASLLLTGDLNETHEQNLLAACAPPACSLAAEVMQVPHHGSRSGLAPPFLQAITPQVALVPVGLHNMFHHPAPSTLKKLSAAHIPVFRTDVDHRIHIVFETGYISVSTESGKNLTLEAAVPSVPP